MEKSILRLLKDRDWAGYQKFLAENLGSVNEKEEAEFFKIAPDAWKESYLKTMWPSPPAEKCLMISGSLNLLKLSHDNWGFFEENLKWALKDAPLATAERVFACLDTAPNSEVERAMLERKSSELMLRWVKKFKGLSDEGESLIQETLGYQSLKTAYIDYMICAQA